MRALNLSRLLSAITNRYTVTRLQARTTQRGLPASVLVVGTAPRAHYLAEIFLQASSTGTPLGAVPLWALPRTLEQLAGSVDLVVARVGPRWARLLFGHHYLCVPEWVDQWLTVPDDPDSLCRGKHGKSLRKAIRRAHEHGITFQVSHSDADLEEFYHQYHVPFARHHFGQHARIDNRRILRRLFRQGGLIWALHNDQRVAASVYTRQGAMLRLVTFAMVTGKPNLTELGVHTALNWFEIQHAHDLGCREIHFGGARGLLTDGVLRHKRKWQTRLVERRQSYLYLLHWQTLNPSVLALLAAAPLVILDRGNLSAVGALDAGAPASQDEVTRAYHFLWTSGLHTLHLLSPSGFQADVTPPPQTCLVDLADRRTKDLSKLLSTGAFERKRS
jgi:hypothetical protein